MADGDRRATVRGVQVLFEAGAIGGMADGALLRRFAGRRDGGGEAAFALLVERHGPMVLRVCRMILADPHEADDAFQATFLVLAQKAGSLSARETIGPWLYQVAVRVASCARSAASRRRRHEARAAELRGVVAREPTPDDVGPVLHAELAALPERYRSAVVLCCLEGRTHAEAARQLGCPVGTVESRLARGRERLRDRLSRRGIAPSVVLLGASTDAALPEALLNSTARIASLLVAGRSGSIGAASAGAALLWKQVSGDMLMAKIQLALVALVATLALPAVALTLRPKDAEEPPAARAEAKEPSAAVLERIPSRLEFGTLHVGGRAEGSATLFLDEDDEWGPLDVKAIPPHFVKVQSLSVGSQTRGKEKVRRVSLGLAIDTSRPNVISDHVLVECGGQRVEVPVSARVLKAEERLTKVLVITPGFGAAANDPVYYRPWFDLVESAKLDVSYADPSYGLHEEPEAGIDGQGRAIVPEWMKRYDVILLVDGGPVYVAGFELLRFQSYVRGGGRLVVGASSFMHGSVPNANDLLRPFGIEVTDEDVTRRVAANHSLAPFAVRGAPAGDDAILNGVKTVVLDRATPMRATAGGLGKILLPDPEDSSRGFAAIARDDGEVIVLGPALFFDWLGEKDEGADNAALVRNILTKPRGR